MDQISDKRRKGIGWGVVASVALHVAVVAVVFVKLPELPKAAEEETVNVDLVQPPEETPEEKASEEKLKEEAQRPPPKPTPPPEPDAPSKTEEAQAENSKAARSALKAPRLVFEFGQKDAGPQQPGIGPSVVAPKPADTVEQRPTEAGQSKPTENQASARPVPQDVTLPEVKVTEVHPEKNGPEVEGTGEAKTEFKPEKPQKETTPDEKQASAKSLDAKQDEEVTKAMPWFSPNAIPDLQVITAMGELSQKERIKELCTSYLQLQLIYGQYYPRSTASAFATSSTRSDMDHVAFQDSTGQWYDLSFGCEVNSDATEVIDFHYDVGGVVPKEEYASRGIR